MIHQLLTYLDPRRSLRAQIGLVSGGLTILLVLLITLTTEFWQQYVIWVVLGLGLVFVLVGWMAAGRIAKPLMLIAQRANEISSATEPTYLPIYLGQNEVAVLSQSLAQLVTDLTEAKAELEGRVLAHSKRRVQ